MFDAVGLHGVEKKAGGGSTGVLDAGHHTIQSVAVGAPTKDGVIALLREAPADVAAYACTGAYNETNGLRQSFLRLLELRINLRIVSSPPTQCAWDETKSRAT
jgi:hypothetical protein